MSQNDLVIANQSFPATRADINSALQALGSLNSGSSAPATTYANMLWYDTTNNTLKMRAEANDQWISIGYLDQTADAFRIFDDTQVVNSSGTQTGIIGDQATSAWQAGTSTTESLVSPAKVKGAINSLIPVSATPNGFITIGGVKQQWGRVQVTGSENQDFSITFGTSFSSSPWSIITTVESDSGAGFDLFEAYVRTKSSSGFTGRLGSSAGGTYPNVFINYLATGPQ